MIDTTTTVITQVTIDEMWLTFLVATVLPMLAALVIKRWPSSAAGAVVLVLLSVISGWLTSLQATGGTFEPKAAAVSVVMTFVTAVGSHFGLLKPLGVTGTQGLIVGAKPENIAP